jgi:hypothetical protein
MIRVLVAEDMRILRDTLVSVLNLGDDITVVAQVAAGTGIVPAALTARRPRAGTSRDPAGDREPLVAVGQEWSTPVVSASRRHAGTSSPVADGGLARGGGGRLRCGWNCGPCDEPSKS